MVDQELELGLRSVSVSIFSGRAVIGAVNVGTQAARVPLAELHSNYLPALRRIGRALSREPFG